MGRTRVAAGLVVLLLACGSSARWLQENTIPDAALSVPDGMTVLDSRFARLRPALPRDQVICFIAEPGLSREKADGELFSAQYGLAPALLTRDSDCESYIELTSRGACIGTRLGETCEGF